jgi:nucleotide-binding universal stress UspA family protein
MFHSLLIALDGTPFGENALPLAISVARRSGAKLELVHLHVPRSGGTAEIMGKEARYLEELARQVKEHAPDLVVTTTLLDDPEAGSVAEALAHHADKCGHDLIVLNSHARGGLARWWLGNVADELVRRTPLPVLVTPHVEGDPDWRHEPEPRHILVPLDGSGLAEAVFPAALGLGTCMGAEYTLLRVVEPAPMPVADPVMVPAAAYDSGLTERQQASAESYLDRVTARLQAGSPKLRLHTHVVLDTEPAEAICEFLRHDAGEPAVERAAPPPVDLVALATHGREGLARLLLGSVADRVLQHTSVPLLLQRPAEVSCKN